MYPSCQHVKSFYRGNRLPGARLCIGMKQKLRAQLHNTTGYYFLCLLAFFFLQSFSKLQAQHETNYAVHANIIYHFTKYIDWPANKKTGAFVIGVVGDTPLFEALEKNVANKKVGEQDIVIKKIKSSAPAFSCHILFISDEESDNMKKIVSKTADSPVLLVSESEGLAEEGSCINFVVVSDHLKLEINKNNIEQRNLHVASELLKLGKIVK